MARKRYSDEDILKLLREIELKLADGDDVRTACRGVGVSDATYYNWRRRFGGMGKSQLSELRSLEKENARLKKIVAELELDNCPVEIAEARYGYEVLEKSLIFSEGNAVEFRGGPGICSRYQMRAKATLSAGFSRAKEPVWSLNATSGHTNSLKVHRARQTVEDYVFVSGLELAPEDVVEIRTSCGGNAARAG